MHTVTYNTPAFVITCIELVGTENKAIPTGNFGFQGTVDCIFCLIMNRYFLFSFFYFHFLLITFVSSCETFEMIYESKLSFSLRFFYDLQLRDKSKKSSQLDATSSSSSSLCLCLCLFLSYFFTTCHKNERSGVCYCH